MGQFNFQFRILSYFLFFTDCLSIIFSWQLCYWIRFYGPIPDAQRGLDWSYAALLLMIIPIHFYYFFKRGLYLNNIGKLRLKEISFILSAKAKSFFTTVFFLYFFYPHRISRIHLILDLVLSTIFLLFGRLFVWKLYKLKNPKVREKLLLLGEDPSISYFIDKLKEDDRYDWEQEKNIDPNLLLTKKEKQFEAIIVSNSAFYSMQNLQIWEELPVIILPDQTDKVLSAYYTDYCGLPMIVLNRPPMGKVDHLVKRIFDVLASFAGMVLLSPLLGLIALLVKISSKGPIFYGQTRVGLDGIEFRMWKFRSMVEGAEGNSGAVWAIKDDPRKTRLGNLLRKTSLDELPQLYNVLMGEMSLVGPRPERPIFVEKFKKEIPRYALRHKMKAGVTGWAQVNGWRGNTDLNQRVACDLFYIRNWSLWLDIKIILMTLWKGMINKNAY